MDPFEPPELLEPPESFDPPVDAAALSPDVEDFSPEVEPDVSLDVEPVLSADFSPPFELADAPFLASVRLSLR